VEDVAHNGCEPQDFDVVVKWNEGIAGSRKQELLPPLPKPFVAALQNYAVLSSAGPCAFC